jgi:NAD+-dependent protein deacetylase SIR2
MPSTALQIYVDAFLKPLLKPDHQLPVLGHSSPIDQFINIIQDATNIVFFIGAGVSASSGLHTFRAPNGRYRTTLKDLFDYSQHSHGDFDSRKQHQKELAAIAKTADAASPSLFHQLLKILADHRKVQQVFTQNIDGLEGKAGLEYGQNCLQIHGSIHQLRCEHCNTIASTHTHITELEKGHTISCPQCLARESQASRPVRKTTTRKEMRFNVWMYNEPRIEQESDIWAEMSSSFGKADLLVVVGTSIQIPGAKQAIRHYLNKKGAKSVLIDISPPISAPSGFTLILKEDCQVVAEHLLAALEDAKHKIPKQHCQPQRSSFPTMNTMNANIPDLSLIEQDHSNDGLPVPRLSQIGTDAYTQLETVTGSETFQSHTLPSASKSRDVHDLDTSLTTENISETLSVASQSSQMEIDSQTTKGVIIALLFRRDLLLIANLEITSVIDMPSSRVSESISTPDIPKINFSAISECIIASTAARTWHNYNVKVDQELTAHSSLVILRPRTGKEWVAGLLHFGETTRFDMPNLVQWIADGLSDDGTVPFHEILQYVEQHLVCQHSFLSILSFFKNYYYRTFMKHSSFGVI